MCHAVQQWTEALPLVLLGIRTSFKEDLQASTAEVVYSEPLRISGVLLTPTANPVDPAHLITELRQHMTCLRPTPAASYASPATFVHSDFEKCTHVFLRQDPTRRALESPYSGPYKVLSRREKTLQLLVRGRPITVSAERAKPAYILSGNDYRKNSFSPPSDSSPGATQPALPPRPLPANPTPAIPPPTTPQQPSTKTTRSSHHKHFPTRFKT
jgi:hypothetical protein